MKEKTDHSGSDTISVKTHVARDLLQNAALFKTDKLVVWEYVSNSIDYVDEGVNPEVIVTLDSKQKSIVISDNGRGMDWEGLQNFFIMHGENIDRKKGRPGRGKFGTGKSAAFGIADILRVTTIRNKRRSKVELCRTDIEKMKTEDPIPVKILEKNVTTIQPNGTSIEIENIHLKALDQKGIIQYIERHLVKSRNANVLVNNHECEFVEPAVSDIRKFKPEEPLKNKLGDIELVIKIASAPLDEEFRGVSIYSNGVWQETTLAGNEGREMSQYIFGEIDVPNLDKSPIPPFDFSRSMRLNPSNELVQAIYAFIGQKVDYIRRELLKAEKQRKETEEAKKLARQAQAIADVINEDFQDFRQKIARAKAKQAHGFDKNPLLKKGDGENDLTFGSDISASIISPVGNIGSLQGEGKGDGKPRTTNPQVSEDPKEPKKQGAKADISNGHTGSRGGFNVEFTPMGIDEMRAKYISQSRTIFINIDHPQLVSAKGAYSTEDPVFKRLAYEIAFSEYSIALAHELNENAEFIDTSDPIVNIRDTINRIARKAAPLFAI